MTDEEFALIEQIVTQHLEAGRKSDAQ